LRLAHETQARSLIGMGWKQFEIEIVHSEKELKPQENPPKPAKKNKLQQRSAKTNSPPIRPGV